MELQQLMNKHHDKLNDNDLYILSYILENQKDLQNINIVELAKQSHTSKSTVLRLTQKLGFSGFSEFKYSLKQSKEKVEVGAIDHMLTQKKDIEATLKLFEQTNLTPIIEKFHQVDRIFGYGTGWGQQNAVKELSRNLLSCKKHMLSIPAKTEFDINMPIITKNDLVVIISLSGNTKDIIENVKNLNLRGVPVLAITTFSNNVLASLAPYNLYYQVTSLSTELELEQMSFITLNLVCDCLFRKYVEYIAFNKE